MLGQPSDPVRAVPVDVEGAPGYLLSAHPDTLHDFVECLDGKLSDTDYDKRVNPRPGTCLVWGFVLLTQDDVREVLRRASDDARIDIVIGASSSNIDARSYRRIRDLYRRGAFDGVHVDPARDPDSEPGWLNVADCAMAVWRAHVTLGDLEAYVSVRLGGHDVHCGLHGGGRCTCGKRVSP